MSKRREALEMIAKGYKMLAEAEEAGCCCDKAKEAKKPDPAPTEDKADKKPDKRGRKPAKAKEEAKKDSAEEKADGPYASMNAKALYNECVKRGIKCCTRRGADYYIGILEKDDASKNDQDDDWGDEDTSGKADGDGDDEDEWSLD